MATFYNLNSANRTYFPSGTVNKESVCQCKGRGFDSWSGKITHASELLSPCAVTATEAHMPKTYAHNKRSYSNEKPAHCHKK